MFVTAPAQRQPGDDRNSSFWRNRGGAASSSATFQTLKVKRTAIFENTTNEVNTYSVYFV